VRSRQAPGTEVEVALLAAGSGLVACALADGRVNIYDATAEREAAHLWGRPVPGLVGLTCVDSSHVAFTVGSRTTIERIR
jgi:hypothetical protein